MDRLGEIATPTLVIAGRDDFLFPPEHQVELAAGIPNAQLRIIERAGHNAHAERPEAVMAAIRGFLSSLDVVPAHAAVAAGLSSWTRSVSSAVTRPTGSPPPIATWSTVRRSLR